jgi:hypothetical protein
MQTVQETRRQRLGMLKKKYVRWSVLNTLLDWEVTSARLSQIHSGTLRSDRGTPYTMGDDTAREIETKLGLQPGWMDTPPTYEELNGQPDMIGTAMGILQAMEPEARYQAVRLLEALRQPPEPNGHSSH